MNQELFQSVDTYLAGLFAREDAALAQVSESLDAAGIPQISVSATQGKWLHILAKLCGAKKILEIGTLGGYSTIWLARALPADGQLISLELDEVHAAVATKNINYAGVGDNVIIRQGSALESLAALYHEGAGPFDLVFIDADKPPYVEYFEWSLKMTRQGGLIIADNVIREGGVLEADSEDEKIQGVRRFNAMLAAHPAVSAIVLPSVGSKGYDGMALAYVL